MTIYAIGNELESYSNYHAGTLVAQTTFKDVGQRGGIYSNATNIWFLDHVAIDEAWIRFNTNRLAGTSTTSPIMMFTNIGTSKDALRLFHSAANVMRIQYNNTGVTYTTITEFAFPSADTGVQFEVIIYFKRGVSGILRVWIDDNLVVDLAGNYTTVDSTWNRVRFSGVTTSTSITNSTAVGGVVVANEPLHGFTVDHLTPDALGDFSEWSGTHTALADTTGAPQIDLTTFIDTNANSQRFLSNYESMDSLDDARQIRCVQTALRGVREVATTPPDASFFLRLSSADYTLNALVLTSTDKSVQQIMELDPTGGTWIKSSVDALQVGVTT